MGYGIYVATFIYTQRFFLCISCVRAELHVRIIFCVCCSLSSGLKWSSVDIRITCRSHELYSEPLGYPCAGTRPCSDYAEATPWMCGNMKTVLQVAIKSQVDTYWDFPWKGWGRKRKEAWGYIMSKMWEQATATKVRFRYWRKTVYMLGRKPHDGSSPANTFCQIQNAEEIPCKILKAIQKALIDPELVHDDFIRLDSMFSTIHVASWNINSLSTIEAIERRSPELRSITRHSALMLQETHQTLPLAGIFSKIPTVFVRSISALRHENSRTSGGLAWILPIHAG